MPTERIIGDNSDGFQNEIDISHELNDKLFDNLNSNLKLFIKEAFPNVHHNGKRLHATRCRSGIKPDFYITIDGVPNGVYVSVKKGGGNSIHQEKFEVFLEYVKSLGASDEIIKNLKLYHWSDETENNSGPNRMGAKEFSELHPNVARMLNDFFNKPEIVKKLIYRFLIKGNAVDAIDVDYIYHGDKTHGVWAKRSEVIKYLTERIEVNKEKTNLHFSEFSYQIWNACLNHNQNTEDRRKVMQIKWSNCHNALMEIMSKRSEFIQTGTYEGDFSEEASVIFFNRDPYNRIFKNYINDIGLQPDEILMVRVSTKQYSNLSEKIVPTRADAYAVKILDDNIRTILEDNSYLLDESMLVNFPSYYEKIDNSGISIKMASSTSYTILKLTPKSFNKLFNCYELGAGASLFCEDVNDLSLNERLLTGWYTNLQELQDYFVFFKVDREMLYSNQDFCKQLKKFACNKIEEIVNSSPELQKKIFNGIGLYQEPYTAHWFMKEYEIKKLTTIPYNITTGSGRHHGDYTLVLKPKRAN